MAESPSTPTPASSSRGTDTNCQLSQRTLPMSDSFAGRCGMATYVLVGGAWLGGWCWQPVARRLRERGHDAYPVTLTGLGERVHLANPSVNLDTHIADVM